jgi:hypothetical protein
LRDNSKRIFNASRLNNSTSWITEDVTNKQEGVFSYVAEIQNANLSPQLKNDVLQLIANGTFASDWHRLIQKHKLEFTDPAVQFMSNLATRMRSHTPKNACNI